MCSEGSVAEPEQLKKQLHTLQLGILVPWTTFHDNSIDAMWPVQLFYSLEIDVKQEQASAFSNLYESGVIN